jgi:hypothetical protein
MNIIQRIYCIICNGSLQPLYRRPNYPIKLGPSVEDQAADKFHNLSFSYCESCGTVQLNELIDPEILYSENHNNTAGSSLWNTHNQEFYNFIKKSTPLPKNIMEIGGSDGTLLKKFDANDYTGYTIIDLCNDVNIEIKENVIYKKANCETEYLPESDIIIMSHVLEHLYNPRLFLENVFRNTTIHEIYISIPDMETLLNNDSYSFLHFEHTYYLCLENMKFLASICGWTVETVEKFQKHSIFLKLKRGLVEKSASCKLDYMKIKDYFLRLENRLVNIKLTEPSYCFPGGHFGQLLYYYLDEESRKNIIHFVDNDVTKQGKRIYGTDKYMVGIRELKENKTCVIANTPYSEEIINMILQNYSVICITKI